MNLHEFCELNYDSFSEHYNDSEIVIKSIPQQFQIKKLKFYHSEESYNARIPDYEGSCYGITFDPSNDNKICYMNIKNVWFNFISE